MVIETWPTKTPSPIPRNDEEAIRQIINAEGEAMVIEDIDRLKGIWAEDGSVSDVETGRTWEGWKAILDRYDSIVWPSHPGLIEHPNIRIVIAGRTVVAISDTKIGMTTRKDNDRWTLEKRGGSWQIMSLTFGLSPQK